MHLSPAAQLEGGISHRDREGPGLCINSTPGTNTPNEEGTQTITVNLLQDPMKLSHFQTNISGNEQTHLFTCQHHPGFKSLSSFLVLLPRTFPGSDWTPVLVFDCRGFPPC